MARPLRLEFAGALYHITSRGDRREAIYEDDRDRQSFLSLLGEVSETCNWVVYAHCLMSNHYHLLVETPDANVSRGMQQLNGVYTQYYNRIHTRVGHLFQGRYHGTLVDKENYLLELARYIVLNPVRAGMVQLPEDWRWSSYRSTVGLSDCPAWLHTDWLLAAFGKRKSSAIQSYRRFVAEGKGQPSPWRDLNSQIYLGDARFVADMQQRIAADMDLSEIPGSQRRPVPQSLRTYEETSPNRNSAIVSAHASGGYSMREIGEYFGIHYSQVSKILKKSKVKT
jgi:REP element-mobilizing transposase RayT